MKTVRKTLFNQAEARILKLSRALARVKAAAERLPDGTPNVEQGDHVGCLVAPDLLTALHAELEALERYVSSGSEGVCLIEAERLRQLDEEGWTHAHDDGHVRGELADAAACYAMTDEHYVFCASHLWPWQGKDGHGTSTREWDKRDKHNRIRCLAIAGALVAAEIDRLRRCEDVVELEAAFEGVEG